MKTILSVLLALTVMAGQLSAQSRTVSGTVKDEKGAPLAGASVTPKGAGRGTIAANDGSFSLSVAPAVRQLVVSNLGFTSAEITLTAENNYAVVLKTDTRELDQVVITGYSREKKGQFAGAAAVISSKAVETVPVGSFDQALQGRAAGVLVSSGSGSPGAAASVFIRGNQSISGAFAAPLYVMDGVPLAAGVFETLNPNDFESMTVLKDASASAQYGSRAGVGVIVITTRKGRTGDTRIQYRTQFGLTQRPNATNFDVMNSAEILSYEEKLKISGTPGWNYSKLNPTYATLPAATQARYDFILDSMRNINTEVMDIFFRQGFSQQHELNVSGGSDKTRFYLSGSIFDQEGTDKRAKLKRYTTRFNIDHSTGKLSIGLASTVGYSLMDQSEGVWYGNTTRNTFQMSWRAKPYEDPYRADGSLNYGTSTALAPKVIANAIEGIENATWRQNQIKINAGLTLAYKIAPALTLKNVLGIDATSDIHQRWVNPNSFHGLAQTFQKGIDIEANRLLSQIVNTTSLVFSRRFNNMHDFELGAYFEALRGWQRASGFTLYMLDPRLPETGQGAGAIAVATNQTNYTQTASSAKSGFGIRSYFATTRYTYAGKYTLTGSLRRDGTSVIVNPEFKQVTTWSLGGIWNILAEKFMEQAKVFSDLKLRASYGSVPNIGSIPTGNYGALQSASLTSITNYQSAQVPNFGSATYGGSAIPGVIPTTSGNPDLKIETIRKTNIGVDVAVWKNRVRLSVELYRNRTVDLFVNKQIPRTSGFTALNVNAGTMTNKGIEATFAFDVIKKRNVDLSIGFNHAFNKNSIDDLGGIDEYIAGTFLIRKGLPYGAHYDEHYLGADPATGRPQYETQNGGITTDIAQAGRFAKFGSFMPKHVGGFNADVRIGAFNIAAFFSYQFGVVRNNNIESWITRGTSAYAGAVNQSRRVLTEQWQKPGDVAYIQSSAFDRDFTSADLQDAKFLRFRNLNLGYQIPEISLKNFKVIRSARAYIQGQNLWVWSPWRGPDPEDNNNISLNEYPNPRAIVFGIDINF
jgi:TonB-linked SusC/RagA family outer membrane protein